MNIVMNEIGDDRLCVQMCDALLAADQQCTCSAIKRHSSAGHSQAMVALTFDILSRGRIASAMKSKTVT